MLVDTNVVISALLFPSSTPGAVVAEVLTGHRMVVTRWIIDELYEVVGRKRPDLVAALETFLSHCDYELAEPGPAGHHDTTIADKDDQPILDAALTANADVIVTGDKHFLSLDLSRPRILTPRAYLDAYGG
ncbi:putative toxin-antitoxin system toxin component, PIN family [Millisia brevis]|uniref:putative toxin-antitoxin system toxin component, PIN family n=1 Tax=Millisia brevis TaxID=264148 RepID=UPI0014718F12|nr:putative toxin-antitoxin system toxin component, PIN family [Millisia brevis]